MPLTEAQIEKLKRSLQASSNRHRRAGARVWEAEGRWLANRVSNALTGDVMDAIGDTSLRTTVAGSRFSQAAKRRSARLCGDLADIVESYRVDTYNRTRDAHGFTATRSGVSTAKKILIDGKDLSRWLARFRTAWLDMIEETIVVAANDGVESKRIASLARRDIMDRTGQISRRFANILLSSSGAAVNVATLEVA